MSILNERLQTAFEIWFNKQFPSPCGDMLRKNEDKSYVEDTVSSLFIGFCAGIETYSIFKDYLGIID